MKYSSDFYNEMKDSNMESAKIVVPLVLSYLDGVDSMIDIGCGTGIWTKVFKDNGVKEVMGVDGSWVKEDSLLIKKDEFIQKDLSTKLGVDKKFDLAISLEVAEHIEKSSADIFVDNLVNLAPVILFSAAIPLQGGTHHINEQWPSYWEEKFNERGYVVVDCIRRQVWENKGVSFFYAQNIMFFVRKELLSKYPKLEQELKNGNGKALSLVHPRMYYYYGLRWKKVVPFVSKFPVWFIHFCKKFFRSSGESSDSLK